MSEAMQMLSDAYLAYSTAMASQRGDVDKYDRAIRALIELCAEVRMLNKLRAQSIAKARGKNWRLVR